ncbi:MAG: restriction endonuclease subunit M [Bacteroidales bacterium]|nr:restriction endonuclease subunit M [Bacteroidales bacterium]
MYDKDILLKNFRDIYKDIYRNLLFDHTTRKNIIWATQQYKDVYFNDEIQIEQIVGLSSLSDFSIRVKKDESQQIQRTKNNAEVYTPSWLCNAQNNLVDEEWFGRNNVFNVEHDDHTWDVVVENIFFPEKKDWKKYVREVRMEITCGEAPYMVSRYDTTTGLLIPLNKRIGFVDRKFRIINENAVSDEEWKKFAIEAFKSSYGYEWQGDSLLLARENLLFSFIEYYNARFGDIPDKKTLKKIAYIISWNVWQMDGVRFIVPNNEIVTREDVYNKGIYCKIRDWKKKVKTIVEFRNLLKS